MLGYVHREACLVHTDVREACLVHTDVRMERHIHHCTHPDGRHIHHCSHTLRYTSSHLQTHPEVHPEVYPRRKETSAQKASHSPCFIGDYMGPENPSLSSGVNYYSRFYASRVYTSGVKSVKGGSGPPGE